MDHERWDRLFLGYLLNTSRTQATMARRHRAPGCPVLKIRV